MKIIPIVSKRAHLLGVLYDLFHVPNIVDHGYIYNIGEMSKLFYVGYILDQYGLWGKAFTHLINIVEDHEIERYLDIIDTIEIYQWDKLQVELEITANKVLEVYKDKRDDIIDKLKIILGVDKLFDTIYVIFGLNPLKGLYGSLPYHTDNYAVVTIFTRFDEKPERILDLILHEIIHGILHVNRIEIVTGNEEIEEEFIDTLCPEGYLSKLLGLAEKLNVNEGYLKTIIHQYFNEKIYEHGVSLVKYIKEKISGGYLI